MDFQALRKEYEHDGIDETALPECPIAMLRDWFAAATEHSPGRWFESNAMSLATADLSGNVSVRIVLLKEITDSGIQFFTNYESEKGQHIAANPRASVALHWPYLGRQIRLSGSVEKTSRSVSEDYFHSRPRGSQIGARTSQQSRPIGSRAELENIASSIEKEFSNQPIPLPDHWGGYELTAERIEFWQGRQDRMHDRIVFEKSNDQWLRFRLSP